MRVAIVGGASELGAILCEYLKEQHIVYIIDEIDCNNWTFLSNFVHEIHIYDIEERRWFRNPISDRADVIVDLSNLF